MVSHFLQVHPPPIVLYTSIPNNGMKVVLHLQETLMVALFCFSPLQPAVLTDGDGRRETRETHLPFARRIYVRNAFCLVKQHRLLRCHFCWGYIMAIITLLSATAMYLFDPWPISRPKVRLDRWNVARTCTEQARPDCNIGLSEHDVEI